MDLLSKYSKDRVFCDRIKPSLYEQNGQNIGDKGMKVYPTIVELFLNTFDPYLSCTNTLSDKDKPLYVKQLIINIATKIDEDKDNKYDNFNYLKCMDPSLIQQGLQSMNTASCLLYLNDYYGVTTNVYLDSSVQYIPTSDKVRKEFNVLFSNNKWSELSSKPDYNEGEFKDLGIGLVLDVKTKDIYKKYLNPIGKYKAHELVDIAKDMNIPLEKDGKKKVKKELYDNINFYQLNHQ